MILRMGSREDGYKHELRREDKQKRTVDNSTTQHVFITKIRQGFNAFVRVVLRVGRP
jgi:hypothetical protein